jgi:outer membrane protein OmpA-like peptidoglycan-associated protein
MFSRTKTELLYTTAWQAWREQRAAELAAAKVLLRKEQRKKRGRRFSIASNIFSISAGAFFAICATAYSVTQAPAPQHTVKVATAVVLPPATPPADNKVKIIAGGPKLVSEPKDVTDLRPRTIFFLNNTQLAPGSMEIIKEIAPKMKKCARITLKGYADATEAKAHPLSLDRAKWVADRLERNKIAPKKMESQGLGAANFLPGIAPSDPRNRRVIITCEGAKVS